LNRRVVVTGMGLVSSLGVGRLAFADNLFRGACGIRPIERFATTALRSHLGGEIRDFSPRDFISGRNLRRMDRLSQMVTASARMAVEDAALDLDAVDRHRVGLVIGTAFGPVDVAVQFADALFGEGPRRVNPILVPNTVMNAPAGHAAIELGLCGINSTVNHREASAETAIAYAAMQIRESRADVVLTGGGDILSPFLLRILEGFMALSPQDGCEERARPLDRDRNGPVIGEGAGLLCLESLESALSRGARIYCEIVGWGLSAAPAPANDWSGDPAGPVLAMQKALSMADAHPEDIDALSAAASGGINADRLEGLALERLFKRNPKPVVTSIKGALGEIFASGGIRAAAMALSIRDGIVPPTLGLTAPIICLDTVQTIARRMDVIYGMVNACASGGTFAALVLRKFDEG
jgi:3-oxoacyl-[acyl-carrier-protein] synthase II